MPNVSGTESLECYFTIRSHYVNHLDVQRTLSKTMKRNRKNPSKKCLVLLVDADLVLLPPPNPEQKEDMDAN